MKQTFRGRALIVEDHAQTCDVLAQELMDLGYCVTQASTGEEAIEAAGLSTHTFDVAVVDLNLPGHDGCWVIRELHHRDPATVTLAITGETAPSLRHAAYASGAFCFVRKPVDFAHIEALLGPLDKEAEQRRRILPRADRHPQRWASKVKHHLKDLWRSDSLGSS